MYCGHMSYIYIFVDTVIYHHKWWNAYFQPTFLLVTRRLAYWFKSGFWPKLFGISYTQYAKDSFIQGESQPIQGQIEQTLEN